MGKILWRRDRLPTPVFLGFPSGSAGKEYACIVGDLGLIPGLGGSPGEGKRYPLQYSGLENSTDCIVHGVAESDTTEQLSLSLFMKARLHHAENSQEQKGHCSEMYYQSLPVFFLRQPPDPRLIRPHYGSIYSNHN